MTKDKLIEDIISSEWHMFDLVENIGQRASCQDDYGTFRVMRLSQLETWDEDVLLNYWSDHQAAILCGHNLIERKYAYMMRYTAPEYYEGELAPHLPVVSSQKEALIEDIMRIYMEWYRKARLRWPNFAKRGRPADEDESFGMTTVEIYMCGELMSYSEETLKSFLDMAERRRNEGKNMVAMIYDNTARLYGYASLDEAEKQLEQES